MINLFLLLLVLSVFNEAEASTCGMSYLKDYMPQSSPEDSVKLVNLIRKASVINDLDLVFSIISVESAFNAKALSKAGARGLMQVTPIAAEEIRRQWEAKRIKSVLTPEKVEKHEWLFLSQCKIPQNLNYFNVEHSIQLGTCYLSLLKQQYGNNTYLILTAYNGGGAQVERFFKRQPVATETVRYVYKVLLNKEIYCDNK